MAFARDVLDGIIAARYRENREALSAGYANPDTALLCRRRAPIRRR